MHWNSILLLKFQAPTPNSLVMLPKAAELSMYFIAYQPINEGCTRKGKNIFLDITYTGTITFIVHLYLPTYHIWLSSVNTYMLYEQKWGTFDFDSRNYVKKYLNPNLYLRQKDGWTDNCISPLGEHTNIHIS
jgi:hypothetical protein